jgi:hypothetical protein
MVCPPERSRSLYNETDLQKYLSLLTAVTDDYYRVTEKASVEIKQFFAIATQLPLELQGLLVCRVIRDKRQFVALNDAAIEWLFDV